MPYQPIKTKNHALENTLILFLIFIALALAVCLIVLYNHKVDYVRGAEKLRADMQKVQAQSAEAREKIYSLFHPGEMEQFAANLGLVREERPEYVEVERPWVSASR